MIRAIQSCVGCHAHGFAWACCPARLTARRLSRRPARRGFSLPEVLIAMTLGAIVFGLSVELLSVAMHTDSVSGRTVHDNQSIDRLAEQFRDDVRNATAVQPAVNVKAPAMQIAAQKVLTLEMPNSRSVEYSQNAGSLLRTESTNKKITGRDEFALGDGVTARIELQPANHPAEAALVLERASAGPNDSSPIRVGSKLRVAAPIGWDRRFASLADKSQTK